ncbi:MAG: hypothetical protein U0929_19820 [Planctomycetaceae bacterium]
MNSPEFTDPLLQSLEAQLAAAVPQLDAGEQQRMLYACAFGAGAQSARRTVRRWQVATGLLSVLWLALAVPMVRDQSLAHRDVPRSPVTQPPVIQSPVAPAGALPAAVTEPELAISLPSVVSVNLDAWQVPDEPRESWAERLARSNIETESGTLRAGQPWRAELF